MKPLTSHSISDIWTQFGVRAVVICALVAPTQLTAQSRFIYESLPGVAQSQPIQSKAKAAAPKLPKKQTPSRASKFDVQHFVELDRPLDFGEHFWDESFVQENGLSGPTRIVVDLEAEQLYVYRAGVEIARTKITRGWEQYKTPTGIFPILEKDANHYSSTYDNAPMPYNLRLTWKGVAIHGAEVDSISATHGCIGIPLEFAEQLFRNVRKNDDVLVTRNWQRDIYG